MILVIEMITACVLFTFAVIFGTRKNPLNGLHNMPEALQERVASLPQYKDIKVVRTKERIMKKLPALLILAAVFVFLAYESGARNFTQGFVHTFLLWQMHRQMEQISPSGAIFPKGDFDNISQVSGKVLTVRWK